MMLAFLHSGFRDYNLVYHHNQNKYTILLPELECDLLLVDIIKPMIIEQFCAVSMLVPFLSRNNQARTLDHNFQKNITKISNKFPAIFNFLYT